ncbi:type-2 ice-structuring protein-like [Anoplopoma fimbria]|uniref:type-2 ice-structuring protein-like n=1 Tax=Anoplopoma fimbria TaxID=229290 RepID=UPI0023EBF7B1|nr:type-2 ice-structuring protein-like [Anoplopoma fimbria]
MLTVSLLVCAMMALAAADDASTVSPSVDVRSCPDGWNENNGRCFKFEPRLLTWAEAEKNCQSMKGNLASVHSMEEDQFLQAMIRSQTSNNPDNWIGGSDCQQVNIWLWSDGSVFSFSFWCLGEPQGDIQGCIPMNHGAGTCWDDQQCSSYNPSVCAINM